MNRFTGRGNIPDRIIMTDDPMRTKMLAAHHLEYAKVTYDTRGMIGYLGSYNGVDIALLSVGYGESAALNYLYEAVGAKYVVYIGECVAISGAYRLGQVVLADNGDKTLLLQARAASDRFSIPTLVQSVFTDDRYYLREDVPMNVNLVDFATKAIYEYAKERSVAALSILTVSEDMVTVERVDEHVRQSRFYSASRLAFETLVTNSTT